MKGDGCSPDACNGNGKCNEEKTCNPAQDMCVLLDGSGSVNDQDKGNWNKCLEWGLALCQELTLSEEATHFTMVQFSKEAEVEIDWSYDKNTLRDPLTWTNDSIIYMNWNTNTYGGVKKCKDQLDSHRSNASKVMIILTDGQPKQWAERP